MLQRIKVLFKERWKYLLVGYLFGYIFPLIMEGIPSWYYLIPIKLTGVIFALTIGNALYYGIIEKPSFFRAVYIGIKFVLLVVIIVFLFYLLQKIFNYYGIDISPLISINWGKV